MINLRKLFILMVASLVLVGLSSSVAFAQDPDNGKVLWEEQVFQCMRCHGEAGEGVWGPPLAGTEATVQEFIAQVRTPRRFMPTFSEAQVSDEQLTDMHAYLTSLTKPADFTPADAGLPPDAPEGQQLIVQKRCIACHSETGPVRNFTDRGEVPTADAVIAQLRTPKQFMPSFSPDQVSDAEATIIAEFLISQVSPSTLPQSGGVDSTAWSIALLLIGGGLLFLAGLLLRRFAAQ
jgi:mono/diheme cytochrome c family protein